MSSRSKNKVYALLAVVFVVAIMVYLKFSGSSTANIGYGQVARDNLVQRVTIAGSIEPLRSTVVSPPYDGYIKKIYVKLGQKVKTGDPLVSVSQSLQSAESVFPIRASFDGIVVQLAKSEGQFVRQTEVKDAILRVDDLSQLFVYSSAPEIDVVKIRKGQDVIIKASSITDRTYTGTVQDIALAATVRDQFGSRSQVEYLVKISISDPDALLKPGMSALVDIVTFEKDGVLVLPHEFVQKDGDQYFVNLKNGQRQNVKIGLQNEMVVEITEGLKEGQEVRAVDFTKINEAPE